MSVSEEVFLDYGILIEPENHNLVYDNRKTISDQLPAIFELKLVGDYYSDDVRFMIIFKQQHTLIMDNQGQAGKRLETNILNLKELSEKSFDVPEDYMKIIQTAAVQYDFKLDSEYGWSWYLNHNQS